MTTNILIQKVEAFKKCDSGAVTVDWVVLTAAIVGIAMAVIALISSGISGASNGVNDDLNSAGSLAASLFGSSAASVFGVDSGYQAFDFRYDESYNEGLVASTVELTSLYDSAYNMALEEPNPWNLDELAGYERAMVEQGVDIPEGNSSATELQGDSGFNPEELV